MTTTNPIWDAMLAEFGDPTDGEIVMPIPSFADYPSAEST